MYLRNVELAKERVFLQRDPIGFRGAPNLYGYSLQDPVNRIDPTGLDAYQDCAAPFNSKYSALSFNLQQQETAYERTRNADIVDLNAQITNAKSDKRYGDICALKNHIDFITEEIHRAQKRTADQIDQWQASRDKEVLDACGPAPSLP